MICRQMHRSINSHRKTLPHVRVIYNFRMVESMIAGMMILRVLPCQWRGHTTVTNFKPCLTHKSREKSPFSYVITFQNTLAVHVNTCLVIATWPGLWKAAHLSIKDRSSLSDSFVTVWRIYLFCMIEASRPLTGSPMGLPIFFLLFLPLPNMTFSEAKHNEGNLVLTW